MVHNVFHSHASMYLRHRACSSTRSIHQEKLFSHPLFGPSGEINATAINRRFGRISTLHLIEVSLIWYWSECGEHFKIKFKYFG